MDAAANRLRLRFSLQSQARRLLMVSDEAGNLAEQQDFKVTRCLRWLKPTFGQADQTQSGKVELRAAHTGSVYYGNLLTCDSVWVCPICGAKISERRVHELPQVIDRAPYLALFITLTFSHQVGDDLQALLKLIFAAWRKLRQGRKWKTLRAEYGWHADVRTIEITHGVNGWHPHIHVLGFFEKNLSKDQIKALEHDLKVRWLEILTRCGLSASYEFGLRVDSSDSRIASYMSKVGRTPQEDELNSWGFAREMAKHPTKIGKWKGCSPLQILSDSRLDGHSGELFKTYAYATKGHRQLEWSRSPDLRQEVGLEIIEDDEIGLEPAEVLALLDYQADFIPVLRARMRADLLLAAKEAKAAGDRELIQRFLEGLPHNPYWQQLYQLPPVTWENYQLAREMAGLARIEVGFRPIGWWHDAADFMGHKDLRRKALEWNRDAQGS